jgi:hypothetical protein
MSALEPPNPPVGGDASSFHRDSGPEQTNRNVAELLQELRVASIGVQVLFGFLLSLPFSVGFKKLDHAQRGLYLADVLLAALAIVLLGGPVAYHRLVFHHHERARLLRVGNAMAIGGLGAVAAAVSVAVAIVMTLVEPGVSAGILIALTVVTFVGFWFVLPLIHRTPR